jgi:hypothetical protein
MQVELGIAAAWVLVRGGGLVRDLVRGGGLVRDLVRGGGLACAGA